MTRVLIVDDLEENLYMLRALLQGHGYSVEQARHGLEALHIARQSPPDLVISDLLMPQMDGYNLLREWKADARLRGIPFIVYTATFIDTQDERLAYVLGAAAFIIKPAEPEPFMVRVIEVLNQAERGGLQAPSTVQVPDDRSLYSYYSDVLFRKLEKRALELEQSNLELTDKIAECKKVEAALQESEERFRATFEQAAVGIAHVDMDGSFLCVNDKLCEITGYSRDELLKRGFRDFHVSQDAQVETNLLLEAQAGERRYRRQDGTFFWASLASALLRDGQGLPKYYICIITDMTERKLLQEQLRQSQKLESVGQLTGGIAHDFNNLLTVIIGNTDLLVERLASDDPLRPLVEMTHTAARRGSDLIQRLLAFARQQVLEPCALDINALLRGMEGLLRHMLPQNIALEVACDATLAPALADASQLESAVLNLCINARDAMPCGGRLTITTINVSLGEQRSNHESEINPGNYVCIVVSDTGLGIEFEHLTRIFDPFFTTKPIGKGTGLGLSMVYGFVKQSHGGITAQSKLGEGTKMTLYLPIAPVLANAPVLVTPKLGTDFSVSLPAKTCGHECILFVEDDDLVRQYGQEQLRELGYQVLVSKDTGSALQLVRQRPDIELLFTDVVMSGGLSGRQLANAAQALRPTLKVLFCSDYSETTGLHSDGLEGGIQFLRKPYVRDELAYKLRIALAPTAATRPIEASVITRAGCGRLLILDDDPMVGKVLSMIVDTLGFETLLTLTPADFLECAASWRPSHVAVDLSMPDMSGLQVLDRLAKLGCIASIFISSGADKSEIAQALAHAHALGLHVGGALAKPFSRATLQRLLLEPAIAP